MKICYIISDIDKAVYFEETAIALRNDGVQVSFVLINCKNGALARFLKEQQFEVHELECNRLSRSWKAIKQVRGILKQLQPELIHCHLAHANWIGLWAGKLARIPKRIYTRHSGAPLVLGTKEKWLDKIQNRLATRVISISQNIDNLLADQGVPAHKRRLIHHGFNLKRFEQFNSQEVDRLRIKYELETTGPVIGVIARWMEWKGIQYIIPAFEQLTREHPDAVLCLFGANDNADYSSELKQLTQQLPAKNVRVISFEENVYDLFQLFDLYVHVPVNSTCEAFGQTYVEALAAGIPSIFTLSGIAREFVSNGENARVVEFMDSEAIFRNMEYLLHHQEEANAMAARGNESVQRFEFSQYIQLLKRCYLES